MRRKNYTHVHVFIGNTNKFFFHTWILYSLIATQRDGEGFCGCFEFFGGRAEGEILLPGNHDPRGEPAAHWWPLYVQERR